jgi:hypothetical protein
MDERFILKNFSAPEASLTLCFPEFNKLKQRPFFKDLPRSHLMQKLDLLLYFRTP